MSATVSQTTGVSIVYTTVCSDVQQSVNRIRTVWGQLYVNTSWWRHGMERFSTLLAHCGGNLPVTCGFLSQRASDAELWCIFYVTWANCLNGKQTIGGSWFETKWRSCNAIVMRLKLVPIAVTYRKRVAIQIQLMDIHVSECKYYC